MALAALALPALTATARTDLLWWLAFLIQLAALPGTLLPLLPGLALLPLGALLWPLAVGWSVGWPPLALAVVLLLLGWGAEALGLVLGPARLQATRWAYVGAGIGLAGGVAGPAARPALRRAPARGAGGAAAGGESWGSWSALRPRWHPPRCCGCVAACWWGWRW